MSKLNSWKPIFFTLIFSAVAAIGSPAQTFTTLLNFDMTNGSEPTGTLIQGTDGNFYGTTSNGGSSSNCLYGCGTVFRITTGGKLTTLHSFNGGDGSLPETGLVQATDGNFYGTTAFGGANNVPACTAGGSVGCGTVFKITAGNTVTTLYSFCSQSGCTDGSAPYAGLVQAANGNFYGTTDSGGANNFGTVFEISAGGKLTALYSFCAQTGCTDGSNPLAGLVQGTDGNFYGTTASGGASSQCSGGCGTIFEITPEGKLTTLHSFNYTDGGGPNALVQAANGNFYGTTVEGGAYLYYGTVFEVTPEGRLTTLHNFDYTDGWIPMALVQATDGSFYGTTVEGGANGNYGTVFKITGGGRLTTLHNFDLTDGQLPTAVVQATDGNFYGTTIYGGSSTNCTGGCGTIFSLSVGLGPFVETRPTSGKVGTKVTILGNNLTYATLVTFSGIPARFKVVSPSEIEARVPFGATSGKVRVSTPYATLTSNVNFRVP